MNIYGYLGNLLPRESSAKSNRGAEDLATSTCFFFFPASVLLWAGWSQEQGRLALNISHRISAKISNMFFLWYAPMVDWKQRVPAEKPMLKKKNLLFCGQGERGGNKICYLSLALPWSVGTTWLKRAPKAHRKIWCYSTHLHSFWGLGWLWIRALMAASGFRKFEQKICHLPLMR